MGFVSGIVATFDAATPVTISLTTPSSPEIVAGLNANVSTAMTALQISHSCDVSFELTSEFCNLLTNFGGMYAVFIVSFDGTLKIIGYSDQGIASVYKEFIIQSVNITTYADFGTQTELVFFMRIDNFGFMFRTEDNWTFLISCGDSTVTMYGQYNTSYYSKTANVTFTSLSQLTLHPTVDTSLFVKMDPSQIPNFTQYLNFVSENFTIQVLSDELLLQDSVLNISFTIPTLPNSNNTGGTFTISPFPPEMEDFLQAFVRTNTGDFLTTSFKHLNLTGYAYMFFQQSFLIIVSEKTNSTLLQHWEMN